MVNLRVELVETQPHKKYKKMLHIAYAAEVLGVYTNLNEISPGRYYIFMYLSTYESTNLLPWKIRITQTFKKDRKSHL